MLRSRLVMFFLNIFLLSATLLLLSYDPTQQSSSVDPNFKLIPDERVSIETKFDTSKDVHIIVEHQVDKDIFDNEVLFSSSPAHKPFNAKHYNDLISNYVIPAIPRVSAVNCPAMLNNDEDEIKKALEIFQTVHKMPIYEENYLEWLENCEAFKKDRGYILVPLSVEEQNYPLAFSIAMYRDFEQTERLLRAIYQPQNIYCIHVDTKSPLLLHRTVRKLASCFPNVFVPSHLDKVIHTFCLMRTIVFDAIQNLFIMKMHSLTSFNFLCLKNSGISFMLLK